MILTNNLTRTVIKTESNLSDCFSTFAKRSCCLEFLLGRCPADTFCATIR